MVSSPLSRTSYNFSVSHIESNELIYEWYINNRLVQNTSVSFLKRNLTEGNHNVLVKVYNDKQKAVQERLNIFITGPDPSKWP